MIFNIILPSICMMMMAYYVRVPQEFDGFMENFKMAMIIVTFSFSTYLVNNGHPGYCLIFFFIGSVLVFLKDFDKKAF